MDLLLSTAKRLKLSVVICASMTLDDAEHHRRFYKCGRSRMHHTRLGV